MKESHTLYSLAMKHRRLLQAPWRSNPKTPEGWPKRIAIALLGGLAVFLLSLPVLSLLFLNDDRHRDAGNPQNLLHAVTSAVLVGLLLALLSIAALLLVLCLFAALRGRPANSNSPLPRD
jgi:ABC-type Fe3+ transport system permease subunit